MKQKIKDEGGAMVLESALCIVAAMIIFVMILAMGFVVYQHAMMGIVANQVAEDIAVTWKLPNAPDGSSITKNDVVKIGKFRYFPLFNDCFESANEKKLRVLAQARLTKTSLAKDKGGYDVSVERVTDDFARCHYEITVTNKYETLFIDTLTYLGVSDTSPYTAKVYVAGTDVLWTSNSINTTNSMVKIAAKQTDFFKTINNFVKFAKSILSISL